MSQWVKKIEQRVQELWVLIWLQHAQPGWLGKLFHLSRPHFPNSGSIRSGSSFLSYSKYVIPMSFFSVVSHSPATFPSTRGESPRQTPNFPITLNQQPLQRACQLLVLKLVDCRCPGSMWADQIGNWCSLEGWWELTWKSVCGSSCGTWGWQAPAVTGEGQ